MPWFVVIKAVKEKPELDGAVVLLHPGRYNRNLRFAGRVHPTTGDNARIHGKTLAPATEFYANENSFPNDPASCGIALFNGVF